MKNQRDRFHLFEGQQLARTREILTGPRWDDLRFPATAINPVGQTAPPDLDPDEGNFLFASNGTEIIAGIAQMPHSWDEGTGIRPHIHWSTIDTNTGNVYWRFDYEVADVNSAFTGSYTTLNKLAAADGTAEKHLIVGFDEIDMTDFHASCIIKWRISRIGGDGTDTYASDARFLEFDIHYLVNKLGSVREYNNIY